MTRDPGRAGPPAEYEKVGARVSIFRRGAVWQANWQGPRRQERKSLKTTSRKEAVRLALQLDAELERGDGHRPAESAGLPTVVEAYLRSLEAAGRAPKTIAKCRLVARRVLELAGRRRAVTIADVDLAFSDAYRLERRRVQAAEKTLHNELVILKQLVNFAVKRSLAPRNTLVGLDLKQPKPRPQPCWERPDVERVLAAASEGYRPVLTLLADTGLRVGEARFLTWSDVDLQRGQIHVRPKEGWRPKTGDQRVVPLTTRCREMLARLPRRGTWVFVKPERRGESSRDQFDDRRLLCHLKRVLRRLGLPGHTHTLRHSFISWALLRGTPEAVVRSWVGHVDAKILSVYTHVANSQSRAALERLEREESG